MSSLTLWQDLMVDELCDLIHCNLLQIAETACGQGVVPQMIPLFVLAGVLHRQVDKLVAAIDRDLDLANRLN
jgi:hypothetical protein